jgi:hypothetical protein
MNKMGDEGCGGGGGGKVRINVNNEQGRYFRIYKELRQGDLQFPLLFNLVVDALAAILENAKREGRIVGVVLHLLEGGLTHLQYADDTVLLLHDTMENIVNLKFILYIFESMCGMKIIYHMSDVFVIGRDQ